jgi:hypothetical protein
MIDSVTIDAFAALVTSARHAIVDVAAFIGTVFLLVGPFFKKPFGSKFLGLFKKLIEITFCDLVNLQFLHFSVAAVGCL